MKIPIVMTTFNRDPPHVLDTLESLFGADLSVDEVTLIVSESDADFLGKWHGDARVRVRCLNPVLLEERNQSTGKAITSLCSKVALRSVVGPVILLQDDLEFADRWYMRALELVESIEEGVRQRSVVALYDAYKHTGGPLVDYPKKDFYGAQALYFGDEVRRHAVWALDQDRRLGDDVLIRLALQREDCLRLFAANPSLVQHVGLKTTVESTFFHESPTFVQHEPPPVVVEPEPAVVESDPKVPPDGGES